MHDLRCHGYCAVKNYDDVLPEEISTSQARIANCGFLRTDEFTIVYRCSAQKGISLKEV